MNGNELNSMAQRYKDEMMRLYKKSGASAAGRAAQTYSHDTASAQGNSSANTSEPRNIPVSCECRFPTAESIINSIAQTPAALPLTEEDTSSGSQSTSTETKLSGIMLNSSPNEATYTVPSESENPQELMPDFPLPADIPADSSEAVPQTSAFLPSMEWVSMTGDNSWGYLQFSVFTAGGAYPVQGALITVTKKLPSGSGLVRILFSNRSGRTATIALPAPSASLSQSPQGTVRPYSEYSVTVRAKDYYTVRDVRIPIFAGIKTVQPIDLIPLPEYGGVQPKSGSDNSITDSPSVG